MSRRLFAFGRFPFLLAVVAMTLATPLIPAHAIPCDAHPFDLDALPKQQLANVVILTDGAWRQAYGATAEAEATRLIDETNVILQQAGVKLVVAAYRPWSPEDTSSMSVLLHELDAQVPARPGELIIGLTDHEISKVDGLAHVGHVHMVARRHPGRPDKDALVVAHEIGHLLGADHHACDHDYDCVMASKGFDLPARWCGHHAMEVYAGAASLAGAG